MPALKIAALVFCITACFIFTTAADDKTIELLLRRLQDLEHHVRKQDERIRNLEQEVSEGHDQLSKFATKNQQVYNGPTSHTNDTSIHTASVRRRGRTISHLGRRAAAPKVAFSAYLDHVVNHVGIESIIPFNQVILNDGGAYNKITGIFTVPVTGVYLFHYSVLTDVSAYQLVVKLVLDNVNMSDGTSDPFHSLQEIQGGNTVIFRASQGQSIWLAAYNTGDTLVSGREDYRFSTFSGYLLYTS